MELPNADLAIVDVEKIRDYCLNPDHPRGKHKARVFQAVLGYTRSDAEELKGEIEARIVEFHRCEAGEADDFGQRYVADIEIERKGARAVIRTAWIVRRGKSEPRLTTCYVR